MRNTHTTRRVTLMLTPVVLAALVAGLHAVAPPPQDGSQRITAPEASTVTWADIDKLIAEQKFQAAADAVAELREAARAAGDNDDWTRALVQEVQLRTALHGYETAVRFLRDQPWPDDPASRAVLDLFYAQSLVTYAQVYSWEIRGRERVASDDEVDLKRWTLDQIVAEANRAYPRVWSERASVGRRVDRRARPLHRPEQLPAADPRHPARRRHLPVGRAARRHLAVAAGPVERALPARPAER